MIPLSNIWGAYLLRSAGMEIGRAGWEGESASCAPAVLSTIAVQFPLAAALFIAVRPRPASKLVPLTASTRCMMGQYRRCRNNGTTQVPPWARHCRRELRLGQSAAVRSEKLSRASDIVDVVISSRARASRYLYVAISLAASVGWSTGYSDTCSFNLKAQCALSYSFVLARSLSDQLD